MCRSWIYLLGICLFFYQSSLAHATDSLGDTLINDDGPGEGSTDQKINETTLGWQLDKVFAAGNDVRLLGDALSVLARLFQSEEYRAPIVNYFIQDRAEVSPSRPLPSDLLKRASENERQYYALGKILFESGQTPPLSLQKKIVRFLNRECLNGTVGLSSRANFGLSMRILLVYAQLAQTWQSYVDLPSGEREWIPEKNEILRQALAGLTFKLQEAFYRANGEEANLAARLLFFAKGVSLMTLNAAELKYVYQNIRGQNYSDPQMEEVARSSGAVDWRAFQIYAEVSAFIASADKRKDADKKMRHNLARLETHQTLFADPTEGAGYLEAIYNEALNTFKRRAKGHYHQAYWDANWMIDLESIKAGKPISPNLKLATGFWAFLSWRSVKDIMSVGTPPWSYDQRGSQEMFLDLFFPHSNTLQNQDPVTEEWARWVHSPREMKVQTNWLDWFHR